MLGVHTRALSQPDMGTCPLSSTCTRTGALGTATRAFTPPNANAGTACSIRWITSARTGRYTPRNTRSTSDEYKSHLVSNKLRSVMRRHDMKTSFFAPRNHLARPRHHRNRPVARLDGSSPNAQTHARLLLFQPKSHPPPHANGHGPPIYPAVEIRPPQHVPALGRYVPSQVKLAPRRALRVRLENFTRGPTVARVLTSPSSRVHRARHVRQPGGVTRARLLPRLLPRVLVAIFRPSPSSSSPTKPLR